MRMLAKAGLVPRLASRRGVASCRGPRHGPTGRGDMYFGSDAANFALLLAGLGGDRDLRPRLAAREGDPGWSGHGQLVREPGPEAGARSTPGWSRSPSSRCRPGSSSGFLTPLCYGGVCSLMLVAMITNHWKNGFFLSSAKEGYEYVLTPRGPLDRARHPRRRASGRSTTPSTSRSRSSRRKPSWSRRSSGSVAPRRSSARSGGRPQRPVGRLTPRTH